MGPPQCHRAALLEFFRQEDWGVDELEGGGLVTSIAGENGSWKIWIFGLRLGNFEIDLTDGKVRFKTSLYFANSPESLTKALIGDLVYLNASQVDTYFPAIMAVVHGGRTPEEALEAVE